MVLFPHLIGNPRAKWQLTKILSGSLPHLLVFSGPKGVCKAEFAREFAVQLIGEKERHRIESGSHPDCYMLRPEGKASIHPISAIHELLDRASRPAYSSDLKIFIIEEAHLMPASSSNALLKLLEEPKGRVYFILTSSEVGKMLPTIISRSQQIHFHAIDPSEIEKTLLTEGVEAVKAKKCAFLSLGSLKKARLAATKTQEKMDELLYSLMRHHHFSDALFLQQSLSELDTLLAAKEDESVLDKMDPILEKILLWQRDCYLLKMGLNESEIFHQDEIPALKAASTYPMLSLKRVIARISEARRALAHNVAPGQVLEHLFLRLSV